LDSVERRSTNKSTEMAPNGPRALERMRKARGALAEFARVSRLSSRRRRKYDTTTFSKRRGARLFAGFVIVSFVLIGFLPFLAAVTYFGFIASSQFVTEAKFTVQGGATPAVDELSALSGLPSTNVLQDTQVVANYIQSRALVDALQNRLDLRHIYSGPDIDPLSRFNPNRPVERLVEYWQGHSDVSIQLPSGIVTVTVRAFSAQDAYEILRTVMSLSEALVNDINKRIIRDNVQSSIEEFNRASVRLSKVRISLEEVRNREGLLDVKQSGKAIGDLIAGLQKEMLRLRQDYDIQKKYLAPGAHQLKVTDSRLKSIGHQIEELEAKLTHTAPTADEHLLSRSMTRFSELELERRLAEKQYATAAAALELARANAERQQIYIQTFVRPLVPQEARYPKRTLAIIIASVCAFGAWAIVWGLASVARNHMA
jgi:capsular polysaccharide transport system permease protein